MADYREEILDVSPYPDDRCIVLIDGFNAHFSKKDAYMFRDASGLHIMLAQLDLVKFRAFLDSVDAPAALLDSAFDIVNKIGSYGVKGNKRQFVGFNAERKVVNRQKKVQDRSKHYYANDHGFSKVNVPLPERFENQVICADSLELLKERLGRALAGGTHSRRIE